MKRRSFLQSIAALLALPIARFGRCSHQWNANFVCDKCGMTMERYYLTETEPRTRAPKLAYYMWVPVTGEWVLVACECD